MNAGRTVKRRESNFNVFLVIDFDVEMFRTRYPSQHRRRFYRLEIMPLATSCSNEITSIVNGLSISLTLAHFIRKLRYQLTTFMVVNFVTVVNRRIVACGNHDAAGGLQMANRKTQFRSRS